MTKPIELKFRGKLLVGIWMVLRKKCFRIHWRSHSLIINFLVVELGTSIRKIQE